MARKISIPTHDPVQRVQSLSDLGLAVRVGRTTSELRIDTAASLCGVSVSLLSALENGASRAVRMDKLLTVLDGLGLAMLVATKDQAERIVKEAQAEAHQGATP